MANKKVVVAFSGGLDTSYTVMKLTQDGWDVYAACANTGGFNAEQLKKNEENAYKLGAKKYVTLDVTQEYYEKSLKYMIFGNVMRNNCYPISVSSERIFQAIATARYANEIKADAIAHGSTGAGNDQSLSENNKKHLRGDVFYWPDSVLNALTGDTLPGIFGCKFCFFPVQTGIAFHLFPFGAQFWLGPVKIDILFI